MIITKIDQMIDLVRKNKKCTFSQIAKEVNWNEEPVEKIALILEKAGLVHTHYSITMIGEPSVTLIQKSTEGKSRREDGKKTLDEYEIVVSEGQHARGKVRIVYSEEDRRPEYRIVLPEVSIYTRTYFEYVKIEVSKNLPLLEMEGKSKEEDLRHFRLRHEEISNLIQKDLMPEPEILDALSDIVINEMYGLGEIEALIGDTQLEEIIINSSNLPVSVYHRKMGWMKTSIYMKSEDEVQNYAEQIARKIGRQISTLTPILDAHLSSGDRANATLYPISIHGNTLTLRLFARKPWTIVTYLKKENNALSFEMAALLWQAMQYEMNIIVAGGTASGKTSALNSLVALVQPFQRIITIEDTRELMLPTYQWNWVPLVTRVPNPEGLGEVTMLDLIINSLRMRPDRIVMGEIRRKREAEVLFEAMHTGHSVYSTMHADTGSQVIKRLIEPPIEVPPSEVEDINLLVVQYRDRRKNIRRTLEVSEIIPGSDTPELKRVYTWKARDDTFQKVRPPQRYLELMNLHTGMTESEIENDQKEKIAVLDWMLKNKLEDIEDVGKVMKAYYGDPAAIVSAVEKGLPPKKVL